MAEYNPFAEKAGMTRIQLDEPDSSLRNAVEALRSLGFNPHQLANRSYNTRTLEMLGTKLDDVRRVLLHVKPFYFKRLSASGRPYIRKPEITHWLAEADTARLARCLSTLAVLNQTKAYLHWTRPEEPDQSGCEKTMSDAY
jgi:hypothetical protein